MSAKCGWINPADGSSCTVSVDDGPHRDHFCDGEFVEDPEWVDPPPPVGSRPTRRNLNAMDRAAEIIREEQSRVATVALAQREGEEGARQAWDAMSDDLKTVVQNAFERMIRENEYFTADKLRDYITPWPEEMRGSGHLYSGAAHRGRIENTGEKRKSPYRHAIDQTLWHSLVYEGSRT